MDKIFICKTKSGKGLKMNIEGLWYIANADGMEKLLKGEKKACCFSTIQQENE